MNLRNFMKARVLVVDDEPLITLAISHFLKDKGFEVTCCENGTQALAEIEKNTFDVCIVDLRLPDIDGLCLLEEIKKRTLDTGVIIITAYADIKSAVQAIKNGAFDYLAKPFNNEELLVIIEKFLEYKNLKSQVKELKQKLSETHTLNQIIGHSKAIRDIINKIEVIARTDVPVLIIGESGTGKELIADSIQALSDRKDKPYIKINCAAIPENLFEAELFGHEKGAFTGAQTLKKGKIELANGGTLFLDEIAELPLSLQPKLLRILEDGTLYRLGGEKPIKVNVRYLYATSKDLKSLVKEGKFREDLYYRINIVTIYIPPLRERKEDIPPLIDYYLNFFAKKFNRPVPQITEEALNILTNYDYPGNVRELKHALERAVLLAVEGKITINHLPEEMVKSKTFFLPNLKEYKLAKIKTEKEIILKALEESNWNKTQAAKKLGISRKTLWQKLKKLNLLDMK